MIKMRRNYVRKLFLITIPATLCIYFTGSFYGDLNAASKYAYEFPIVAKAPLIVENADLQNLEEEEYQEDMPKYSILLSKELQKKTYLLCSENNINYELALSAFYLESQFNVRKVSRNKDKSVDEGLAQFNNKSKEWYGKIAGVKNFNPFDPEQAIQVYVKTLCYLRDYWENQGITDEDELWRYCLNSYNMGIEQYKKYIKRTGSISRPYDRLIYKYKYQLETTGTIRD